MRSCRQTIAVLVPFLSMLVCAASCGGGAWGANATGEGDGAPDVCARGARPVDETRAAWEESAAEALALRGRLDDLTGARMRAAEEGTEVLDNVAAIEGLFAAGAPSLEDITSAAGKRVVEDAFAEFVELLAAGPRPLVDATGSWDGGAAGGLYGSSRRGINEGGIEPRQIVDKALFGGAALYRYAAGLTAAEVTPAVVDAIAAAWGGNAAFDPQGPLTDSATYTHGMGFSDEAVALLSAARAHAADERCQVRRDEALREFFRVWERALFARVAFYAHAASARVAAAQDDDATADALHMLSEGIGLALGFHGLDGPATGPLAGAVRLVSDSAIEEVLVAMGVDLEDLGASTTGRMLVEQSFAGPVAAVEAALGEALGASEDEVASWRMGAEG